MRIILIFAVILFQCASYCDSQKCVEDKIKAGCDTKIIKITKKVYIRLDLGARRINDSLL